ncbi:conserved membrane hypothetical protein [Candidatus Sulfopaludibacter sp. SbA3]|nr:conserved membrane hypothetical protein [Candidatus Sulfopaludibacter sp. SbA3]
MSLLAFCRWLESTPGSVALHESIWVYPIVESVHVLTLCVFLGLTVILDLRLLGATLLTTPVSQIIRRFMPWTVAGFVIMVVSGALLFYAIPVKTYLNIFFRLKVAFLLMAGLNVAVFQRTASRTLNQWDLDTRPPFGARLAGGVSLALWAAIVICGRMIAYNWFDKNLASLGR